MKMTTSIGFLFLLGVATVTAQPPPVDLSDIPLEELLTLQLEETRKGPSIQLPEMPHISEFSLSYRYHWARFEGYRNGKKAVNNAKVLERFPVLPTTIDQEVHLLQAGWKKNDNLQLRLTLPYIRQETDHIRRMGDPFILKSEGVGDLSLGLTQVLRRIDRNKILMGATLNLPTGSIDEVGNTPRGKNTPLPYAMQLGSGTFDVKGNFGYVHRLDFTDIGIQGSALHRIGENDNGYRLGNLYQLSTWVTRELHRCIDLTCALQFEHWGRIHGSDEAVDPAVAPVADPDLYGGETASGRIGLKVHYPLCPFDGQFFEIAFERPLWSNLNGPQPGKKHQVSLGLGYSF